MVTVSAVEFRNRSYANRKSPRMLTEATLEVGTSTNTDGRLHHHPSIFGACGAAIAPLHARRTKSINRKVVNAKATSAGASAGAGASASVGASAGSSTSAGASANANASASSHQPEIYSTPVFPRTMKSRVRPIFPRTMKSRVRHLRSCTIRLSEIKRV
jgi:hypothetical protein